MLWIYFLREFVLVKCYTNVLTEASFKVVRVSGLESPLCLTAGSHRLFETLSFASDAAKGHHLTSLISWQVRLAPGCGAFCRRCVSAAAAEQDTWQWALCSIRELNFTASLLWTSVFQLASCLKPANGFSSWWKGSVDCVEETRRRPASN